MSDLEKNLGTKKFSSADENFLPNEAVSGSVDDVLTVDERFEKIPKEDLMIFHGIYRQYGKGENYKAKTLAWLSVKSSFEGITAFNQYPSIVEQFWVETEDIEVINLIGAVFACTDEKWEMVLVLRNLMRIDIETNKFKKILNLLQEKNSVKIVINFLNFYFFDRPLWDFQENILDEIMLILKDPINFYEKKLNHFLGWPDKEVDVWKNDENFFFKHMESVTDVDRKKNIEIVNQYQFELLEKDAVVSSDRKLILYCRTDQWGQSAEYFYLVLRQLKNYIKNNSKLFNVIEIVSRGGGNLLTDECNLDDYRRQLYGLSDDVKHHDGVSGEDFEKLAVGGNFLHLSHGVPAGIKYKSVDILPQVIMLDEKKVSKTTKDYFVEIKKVDDISDVPSFKKFKKEMKRILNAVRACEEKEIANAEKYFAEKNKQKNT